MKKLFLIAATTCLIWSCTEPNQPEQPEPKEEINPMAAYFMNPVAWNGAYVEVFHAMIGCTTDTWPADITVNYGDSTRGTDGLVHSGSLKIHATDRLENAGAVVTPDFADYHVFGSSLSGTQTITHTGLNEAGNPVYAVKVTNGIIGGQKDFIYSEDTRRELVKGLDENGRFLPSLAQHEYNITGHMTMVSHVDTLPGYTVTVDSLPMRITLDEMYPTEGRMQIELDHPMEFDLDFEDFQGKVAIQAIDLQFTGKKPNGNYGAEMTLYIQMGLFTVPLTIQCELNELGVVPESVQYKWG
ncbi:MAG: hypothetical protein J5761_05730 [Paludibacteraceae bacterium]|nr:hypothetical protein [Paludibacteraceae bacterium]